MVAQAAQLDSSKEPLHNVAERLHVSDANNVEEVEVDQMLKDAVVNAPQLTFKALFAGVVAGAFGSFLAIYNGLKTGIVPSLNIISALMGFFICKAVLKVIPGGIFTPQENVVIQTTAVACIQVAQSSGFSSGLLAMGKNAAQTSGPGQSPDDYVNLTYLTTFSFCCSVGFFGLFIAFPLRKYAIIDRKLQFPSGTATAAVIQTMHSNADEAWQSLKRLLSWTVITTFQSLVKFLLDAPDLPFLGNFLAGKGIVFDWDLSSCAIGMILPNCINASILLGGVIAMCVINPWIEYHHQCDPLPASASASGEQCWFNLSPPAEETYASSYLEGRAYYFYPGVAMVVVDGFYSIVKLAYLLIKSFVKPDVPVEADTESDPREAARVRRLNEIFLESKLPVWLVGGGYVLCSAVCVFVVGAVFKVPVYQVLLAVILTPLFSVGIIVGVGMTDWDVSASFGKLMLFPFGMMNAGGSLVPALAACMITISACGAAAGMMQNFKTGYLLGAAPLTMVAAQLVGAAAGVVIAPGMFEIFNSAYILPGDPKTEAVAGIFGSAYRVLAGVFASGGLSALPKHVPEFCIAFAILALVMNIISDLIPSKLGPYMPNAMAMSIGLMMGPGVGIDFFLGGLAISVWRYINPEACKKFSVVVASGCLAGGGIGQVLQIGLSTVGVTPGWPF